MEYQKKEYDVTVSESRAESLQKDVEIFEKELYASQQEKLNVHRPNINIRSILFRQIIFLLFSSLYGWSPILFVHITPCPSTQHI